MLGFLKSTLPPYVLWPWSLSSVPNLGSTEMDGWKGWGCCKLKAMELAFCPLFSGRGYSGRQTSKEKFSLWWAEIGQNVMRHKWGKKENKRGKWAFHYQRGSFLKTASNYSTLHIHFTPGSFALYLESKWFCHMWWGEIEADANGPGFGALVVTRERGKETQDFKNSLSGLILFPSV